ncbi:MAG: tetratricopeptide repeat protein [Terracidiphilus sp.]
MAEPRALKTHNMDINSESPWRVTQRVWNCAYSYTTSASEWQFLLARARNGDPEAEWEVADRYADGCKDKRGTVIVKRSAAKSAQWFRLAAEHGSAPAQNNLGILIGNGNGVRKNVKEALSWLQKAFRAGDPCAAQNIAVTYRENGDLKTAFKWFRRAAEAGDGDALIQLGIHYYWGKGVRNNPRAAVRCFRAATKVKNISGMGRDDAFFFLGIAYYEGRGVKPSIPNARKFFQQANIDSDHVAADKMLRKLH